MVNKGIDDKLAAETDPEKALEEIENNSISLLEFLNPDHRVEIIRAIGFVGDEIDKELLTKAFAKKLKISPKLIRSAVGEEDKPIISANFPGLIDLVFENSEGSEASEGSGTPYLIKDGEDLVIERKYFINGLDHVPPQQVPWLLVSGKSVINYYKKLSEGFEGTELYNTY